MAVDAKVIHLEDTHAFAHQDLQVKDASKYICYLIKI